MTINTINIMVDIPSITIVGNVDDEFVWDSATVLNGNVVIFNGAAMDGLYGYVTFGWSQTGFDGSHCHCFVFTCDEAVNKHDWV